MRALFINGREDAERNPGGDNIQMLKTGAALAELGVEVCVSSVANLDDLPEYDIAHLFNIQTPVSTWKVFERLQSARMPVVLSPIYWDMYAHWFEEAALNMPRWRTLVRLMGKKRARSLYIGWQMRKAPANPEWQAQQQLLKQAWRVLPNSRSEADLLKLTFALPGEFLDRVDIVPNGIDPTLYRKVPQPDCGFVEQYGVSDFILEVGTIYAVKNQLGLIEALFDLPIPLVFIGQVRPEDQAYFEACKTRADERGNVIFIERVDHESLPGIYSLAAVHALPSWRETPGLVSLEAGAAGCRVVSTSIGSTRDYFGNLAQYCDPHDPASIRKAVEQALASPRSPDLRRLILDRYTWQKAAEATLSSYNQALGLAK